MKGMPENNQKFKYLVDWTTKLTSFSNMRVERNLFVKHIYMELAMVFKKYQNMIKMTIDLKVS